MHVLVIRRPCTPFILKFTRSPGFAETPQQKAWLDAFTRSYNERTAKSKAFSQQHRELMADPRVVTGYERGITIAAAARRAERARHPDEAQEIMEKATRLLIRRVAKGDSESGQPVLAKTA